MRGIVIGLFLLFWVGLTLKGQEKHDKLKVFIDCSNTRCDFDYFRTEITSVDFYRDRVASEVHVLITSNNNASGGKSFQMIFYGQNGFSHYRDTLRYNIPPNSTDFERRKTTANYLQMGLMPLIAKTTYGETLELKLVNKETGSTVSENTTSEDKWNYWVFRVGGNGSLNFDQNKEKVNLRVSLSGNRTTEESKYGFWFSDYYRYEENISKKDTTIVKNSGRSFSHYYVKSISEHWSVGYSLGSGYDTYSNIKFRANVAPAIEYSFFPYQDFNNRFLTFNYSIGPTGYVYYDSTIYDLTEEVRMRHNLEVNLNLYQKWGVIDTGLRYRNFLHDFSLYNMRLYGRVQVRITGGLSFETYVNLVLDHDQINLVKGDASHEDLLSQKRELQSAYRFNCSVGLNYRFGSKLNNFVNPRFDD